MATERLQIQPDEEVLMQGPLLYGPSTWGAVKSVGILTTKRLALSKKLNPMLSIIPRLFVWIKGRKIVIQIPLEDFHSIRHDRNEMGNFFIIRTIDGSEYPVASDALFGKNEKDWIDAISDAVKGHDPTITVREEATFHEFVR